MSNKANPFANLSQEHSDDEDTQAGHQTRKDKRQTNKKDTQPREEKPATTQVSTKTQEQKAALAKEEHKKKKAIPESGTHPLDRHSGTGQPAFDKKNYKKGGHGKGNVGVATQEGNEETKEEEEEKPQEEQKPEGITLEEWYSQQAVNSAQTAVDQAKAKTIQDELTKDLLSKKATLYQRKKGDDDEGKVQKKKGTKVDIDHHASLNTDHADLLNFRTGFIEREFKERPKDGERPPRPAPKKEEKTEEVPATEGEKTAEVVAEGEEGEKGEKGEENKDKRGGRGGYKGNRGGNNYRGGNKGGNRTGNYNSNKSAQTKINFEDESAFPKLG